MLGKYTLLYESPKNWGYYVHAQTVCTRPLLGKGGGGGEGPGDEAISSIEAVLTLQISGSWQLCVAAVHVLCQA